MTADANAPLRLVAYVRVSTRGQVKDGYGLDAQRAELKRWAKANGHRIVQWCVDEAVSGTTKAVDREGLTCALDAIDTGTANGLLLPRLDRLARVLHEQEAMLAHVWNRKARVFAADHGEVIADDPHDPMRTAIRQMMGVFAALDRAMIVKRLADGRRTKELQGGYAGGPPPYGRRAELIDTGERLERALVDDPAELAVVERIMAARAAKQTFGQIADALNADGIPTKRGGQWHPSTVQRIADPAARDRDREKAHKRSELKRARRVVARP